MNAGNFDKHSDALSTWLDGDTVSATGDPASGTVKTTSANVATGRRKITQAETSSDGISDSIAESLVIHGLLKDAADDHDVQQEHRIQRLLATLYTNSVDDVATVEPRRRSVQLTRLAMAVSLVASAACLFLAVSFFQPASATAAVALDQIIRSVSQSLDRAYRLHVLAEYPSDRRPQNMPEDQSVAESEEELDGATLYVGGLNRYVFVRQMKDGQTRVSGCDGLESWAFRNESPIHISSELNHFRGGLPGNQQSFGFTDLYSLITKVKDGYDVQLQPLEIAASLPGESHLLHRLTGERKSRDVRGPKYVEIDFDPRNGMIHRMVLDGLPRGRGGPMTVEFTLISQTRVEDQFYSHNAHHESGRRVKSE